MTHEFTTIVGFAEIPNPYINQKIAPTVLTALSLKTFSIRKETRINTVPMYPKISQFIFRFPFYIFEHEKKPPRRGLLKTTRHQFYTNSFFAKALSAQVFAPTKFHKLISHISGKDSLMVPTVITFKKPRSIVCHLPPLVV